MTMASTLVYNECFEDGSAIMFTYRTAYNGYIVGRYVDSTLKVESPFNLETGKPSASKMHIKEAKEDMQKRLKNFREFNPDWFKKHRQMYKKII